MPNTTRMGWPYPSEFEDPWWAKFEQLVASMDLDVFAAREDRNIFVTGGGTLTFDLAGDLFTWSEDIAIVSPYTGLLWTILAGSLSIVNGQMAYVTLDRAPTANRTLTLTAAVKVPSDVGAFLLFIQKDQQIFYRGGPIIEDGVPVILGPPLPELLSGQIFVGSVANLTTAASMSGDVAITNVGVTTIQPAAVTPAKADLTEDWDHTSGTLQSAAPSAGAHVVNKTYVDAIPRRVPASGKAEVEGPTVTVFLDQFPFDPTEYPTGVSFYFVAVLSVTDVLRTVTVELFDITNSEASPVTDSSIAGGSLAPTILTSPALTVGTDPFDLKNDQPTIYEVRLSITGGIPLDFGILGSCYLLVKA